MAATYVQLLGTGYGSAGTTTVVSPASKTVTVGNDIFVSCSTYGAATSDSVADNLGNTYTAVARKDVGSNHTALYRAPVTTGGSLTSITLTKTSGYYSSVIAGEFSGVGTLASDGGGLNGTGTTATWDNNKTIPANGVAIGCVADGTTSNIYWSAGAASGTPSTTVVMVQRMPSSYSSGMYYAIAGASDVTGFTGTATWSASVVWVGAGANFNPASDHKTVTPGVVGLTLSPLTPVVSVSDHQTVTPDPAAITATLYEPTVTATEHQTVTPDAASITLSLFAPTVTASDHQTVTPDAAALTLALFAPVVATSDHQTVTPGAAALTAILFAPTVTASDHISVISTAASLALTAFAPTVTASDHKVVTPDAASLVMALYVPTVTAGVSAPQLVTPGPLSLTLLTYAPTVTGGGAEGGRRRRRPIILPPRDDEEDDFVALFL